MTVQRQRRAVDLVVVHDELGSDMSSWESLVHDVAGVVGLEPSYLPVQAPAPDWLAGVLRAAAASPGPVLVLPRAAGAPARLRPPRRLRAAIIASDDSAESVHGARKASLLLLRGGVQVTVLLALTAESAPPIWEGAGHHAAAWREELERRYGRPDRIEVRRGLPGPIVRAHSEGADLVVLLWRQAIGDDRAPVVRAVLDQAMAPPCLLVPLAWMAAAPLSAGSATGPAVPLPT